MRYAADRRPTRLFSSAFLSPFARLDEAPVWGKMIAGVVAAAELVLGAPFVQLLLLLSFVGLLDYLLGSEIAKRNGQYDCNLARAGAIGKTSGVLLALILRAAEAVIANAGLVDTNGALATALAVVLLTVELESYDQHRETLTGKPTPLLRPLLDFLRGIAEGVFSRSARKTGGAQ